MKKCAAQIHTLLQHCAKWLNRKPEPRGEPLGLGTKLRRYIEQIYIRNSTDSSSNIYHERRRVNLLALYVGSRTSGWFVIIVCIPPRTFQDCFVSSNEVCSNGCCSSPNRLSVKFPKQIMSEHLETEWTQQNSSLLIRTIIKNSTWKQKNSFVHRSFGTSLVGTNGGPRNYL